MAVLDLYKTYSMIEKNLKIFLDHDLLSVSWPV